jgi:hypothetical protein
MATGVQKHHSIFSRLLLRHVMRRNAPGWSVFRLLFGGALCMIITRVAQSPDYLSTVFNFFKCISQETPRQAVVEIREVFLGSIIGMVTGIAFAAFTELASQWPASCVDPSTAAVCSGFPDEAYFLHALWTVPLGISVVFYIVSLTGWQGPDFLQLGTGLITLITMVCIPFTYPPLRPDVAFSSLWSPIIMSIVVRVISVVTTCAVALLFAFFGMVNRSL